MAAEETSLEEVIAVKHLDIKSFFTGAFLDAILAIPDELLHAPELTLQEMVCPTDTDWRLRNNLWSAFETARDKDLDHVKTIQVYGGVCSDVYFYRWIQNKQKLAWAMHRLTTDEKANSAESYYYLSQKIRHYILTRPITEDNLGDFVRLAKFLSDRAYGPVTQKIEARTLSATVDLNKVGAGGTPEQIKEQIKELETALLSRPGPVDVTPT